MKSVFNDHVRNKRGILIIACLIAMTLGFVFWSSRPEPEPIYHGNTLTEWIRQLPNADNYSYSISWAPLPAYHMDSQFAAEEALQQMGTNALPALLRKLRVHGLTLEEEKDKWADIAHQVFKKIFSHGNNGAIPVRLMPVLYANRQNWDSARGFHALGRVASPAIPELVSHFQDPNMCPGVAYALSGMGPEGLHALTQALTNRNEWVQACALWAMGQSPSNSAEVVPQLLPLLDSKSLTVRLGTAWSLGQIRSHPEAAAPALAAHLTDTQNIRTTKASLNEYGLTNFTAPALENYLNDPRLYIRMASTNALRALYPDEAAREGIK